MIRNARNARAGVRSYFILHLVDQARQSDMPFEHCNCVLQADIWRPPCYIELFMRRGDSETSWAAFAVCMAQITCRFDAIKVERTSPLRRTDRRCGYVFRACREGHAIFVARKGVSF